MYISLQNSITHIQMYFKANDLYIRIVSAKQEVSQNDEPYFCKLHLQNDKYDIIIQQHVAHLLNELHRI